VERDSRADILATGVAERALGALDNIQVFAIIRPVSALLRALNTPRRREILRLVWDGERSVGEIHAGLPDEVSIATVSEHLQVLAEAGLVSSRRAGRFRYYRAEKAELGPLAEWLESMWDGALARLTLLAELEAARRGPRAKGTKKRRKRSR
jgi:DNA-binding transcriptional ArsR family regulator